jgi:fatty acid desaturase
MMRDKREGGIDMARILIFLIAVGIAVGIVLAVGVLTFHLILANLPLILFVAAVLLVVWLAWAFLLRPLFAWFDEREIREREERLLHEKRENRERGEEWLRRE